MRHAETAVSSTLRGKNPSPHRLSETCLAERSGSLSCRIPDLPGSHDPGRVTSPGTWKGIFCCAVEKSHPCGCCAGEQAAARVDRVSSRAPGRVYYGWVVIAVTFLALLASAGMRSAPGVLMVPLEKDFGWTRASVSSAVAINLLLYGLFGPFAAALTDSLGVRRVMLGALGLLASGALMTTLLRTSWQFDVLWGVVVGLGTGTIASCSEPTSRTGGSSASGAW
jgi:hypothetical protein